MINESTETPDPSQGGQICRSAKPSRKHGTRIQASSTRVLVSGETCPEYTISSARRSAEEGRHDNSTQMGRRKKLEMLQSIIRVGGSRLDYVAAIILVIVILASQNSTPVYSLAWYNRGPFTLDNFTWEPSSNPPGFSDGCKACIGGILRSCPYNNCGYFTSSDRNKDTNSIWANLNRKPGIAHVAVLHKEALNVQGVHATVYFNLPYTSDSDATRRGFDVQALAWIYDGSSHNRWRAGFYWWQIYQGTDQFRVWTNGQWATVLNMEIVSLRWYRLEIYVLRGNPSGSQVQMYQMINGQWNYVGAWASYQNDNCPAPGCGTDQSWWVSLEQESWYNTATIGQPCTAPTGWIQQVQWIDANIGHKVYVQVEY